MNKFEAKKQLKLGISINKLKISLKRLFLSDFMFETITVSVIAPNKENSENFAVCN